VVDERATVDGVDERPKVVLHGRLAKVDDDGENERAFDKRTERHTKAVASLAGERCNSGVLMG
jgi:hypothetical protein